MQRPSILVTGGTGLLGRACLHQLVVRHGVEQIAVLVRRGCDTSRLRSIGVSAIEVELTASNLGLAGRFYHTLTESARLIIHCAADIRFDIPLEESWQVNVTGTENVLRFALSCPKLDKFAHMSTVYVSGGRPGHIPEQEAKPGPFFNSYQRTKFEAEAAVLRAMGAVPATIYRFSTMVYDRTAGRVAQFNYFHQLLRLASVNPLQAVPGIRQAKVDMILSDWAAQIFDFLLRNNGNPTTLFISVRDQEAH
jgi:thioester reductase-like protein